VRSSFSGSKLEASQSQPSIEAPKKVFDEKQTICVHHGDTLILLCLKDQERVCARCLNSTHLLHPVVPLESLD